ncbi:MAG: hypothetical protein H6581_12590 [Bacteroidia bacterium]|nr:hypothetical protein [Bacteroidia bacterium]
MTEGKEWKGYKIDFVIERKEGSKRFRQVVKAIHDCSVGPNEIKHLNMAARRMSGRYVKIEGKLIALPENGNPLLLESGFSVMKVPGFLCGD